VSVLFPSNIARLRNRQLPVSGHFVNQNNSIFEITQTSTQRQTKVSPHSLDGRDILALAQVSFLGKPAGSYSIFCMTSRHFIKIQK